jgi:hypothetical protein
LSVKELSDWVAKTVAECEEYWLRCSIPRVVVDEWRSDLEAHIAGAIEAGKDPSAVVGSAREWAQEQARDYLKSQSPVDRTLGWAALVLLTSTLVVAPQHILHTTWNFTLGWRAIALIVVLVAVTKLLRSSMLTFLVFNPLRRKGLVMFGDYWAFGAGAIVGAFLPLNSVMHGTSGIRHVRRRAFLVSRDLVVCYRLPGHSKANRKSAPASHWRWPCVPRWRFSPRGGSGIRAQTI